MKSFLQEIEDKFIEIEEAINVPTDKLKDPEIQKLAKDPTAQVNVIEDDINEIEEGALCEKCGGKAHEGHCHNEEQELEEVSNTAGTSGGQGPPKVPFAFGDVDDKTITQGGYIKVQEAMDRKYEQLIESYTQFSRGDKKITPENKVKRTIQEVSKKLKEIETLVNHTSKLKTESGISRNEYGPRTETALRKISEKLIKIAERVRAIGE